METTNPTVIFPEPTESFVFSKPLRISDYDDIYVWIIYGTLYTYIGVEYCKCINDNLQTWKMYSLFVRKMHLWEAQNLDQGDTD